MCAKRLLLGAFWAGLMASQAGAYTLYDFKTNADVLAGNYYRWTPTADPLKNHPGTWKYAVQSSLLGGLAGAQTAVTNALSSWDQANSSLSFSSAGYQPVLNTRDAWLNGYKWEGPGAAGGGVGMGANIDVFSLAGGTTFTDYRNVLQTTPTSSLARTYVCYTNGSYDIKSVDIVLNSSFNWSTTGGNFDVQTVVLHELGHSLGLDHPNQAVANGAANYSPTTHLPGAPYTRYEVMDSDYYPDGINRTLTTDEIGGLAFLCPVTGDTNTNGRFTLADVYSAINILAGSAPLNRVALRNSDLNKDGRLTLSDIYGLIDMLYYPNQSAPQDFAINLLEEMGYDVSTLPEPNAALLLLAGFATWRRRRGLV